MSWKGSARGCFTPPPEGTGGKMVFIGSPPWMGVWGVGTAFSFVCGDNCRDGSPSKGGAYGTSAAVRSTDWADWATTAGWGSHWRFAPVCWANTKLPQKATQKPTPAPHLRRDNISEGRRRGLIWMDCIPLLGGIVAHRIFHAVIWGFLSNNDVMGMTLPNTSRGNLDKAGFGLELGDGSCTAVAHARS